MPVDLLEAWRAIAEMPRERRGVPAGIRIPASTSACSPDVWPCRCWTALQMNLLRIAFAAAGQPDGRIITVRTNDAEAPLMG